jgi:hypothetical protein
MANISGTFRHNKLFGTPGRDTISALAGNDTLIGKGGNDRLNGADGRDTMRSGGGNDSLNGGAGNDSLFGGNGRDRLDGGVGNDFLVGNAGADVFVLRTGMDTVNDWTPGEGDVLDLRGALGNYNPRTDNLTDFVEVTFNQGTRSSTISIDANGAAHGHNYVEVGLLKSSTYTHVREMIAGGTLLLPGSGGSDDFESTNGTAAEFKEFLGVVVEISPNHQSNGNAGRIIDRLDYLGIENVRAGVEAPIGGHTAPIYDALANAGIDFNFLMRRDFPSNGPEYNRQYIDYFKDFLDNHSGSIKSIEGINEVGSPHYRHLTFNGTSNYENAAVEYQKFLYDMINSDSRLSDIPVLNFSVFFGMIEENFMGYGNLTNHSDSATAHVYVNTELRPYYELINRIDYAQILNKDGPVAITETGYTTNAQRGHTISVDEMTQAKLTLNMIMDAYDQGVDSLYIYELFDERMNDMSNVQSNFGLFKADGTPKLAAHAIHNLTTVIGKPGGAGPSESVGYDLKGEDADTHSFALGKTGGVTDLVIWREDIIWNRDTASRINVGSDTIEVDFNKTVDHVRVYDPMQGTNAIRHIADTDGISIQVSDHPIILELEL